MGKNAPAKQEMWGRSLGWEEILEEGTATPPVLLPGESHGQRSLTAVHGVCKELDTTERLNNSDTLKVHLPQE